jgi:hypothetical protein
MHAKAAAAHWVFSPAKPRAQGAGALEVVCEKFMVVNFLVGVLLGPVLGGPPGAALLRCTVPLLSSGASYG